MLGGGQELRVRTESFVTRDLELELCLRACNLAFFRAWAPGHGGTRRPLDTNGRRWLVAEVKLRTNPRHSWGMVCIGPSQAGHSHAKNTATSSILAWA